MKRKLTVALGLLGLLMVLATPVVAQKTVVVVNKPGYGPVSRTTTGLFWTSALVTENYDSALLDWRTTGSPATCTILVTTGPTAALATLAPESANTTITCTSSGTKVVNNANKFTAFNLSALTGGSSPAVSLTVTLTNTLGRAVTATIATVEQGDGAASPGALPWYVQGTDGTNKTPAGDVKARSIYVRRSDGTNEEPAGDTQARGISTIPGNGTNADKQMLDGVGALGAGVKQVATLGTLSAAVASASMTQVVAVNAGARVLLGVIIETATNAAGIVTVSTGTGTNCGTSTATKVVFGIGTATSPLPVGYYPVNALVPAGSAICLTTDAATTSARVLTQ